MLQLLSAEVSFQPQKCSVDGQIDWSSESPWEHSPEERGDAHDGQCNEGDYPDLLPFVIEGEDEASDDEEVYLKRGSKLDELF